jgi:hypothetical protein
VQPWVFPYLGINIAELGIPDGGSIVWGPTTSGPDHDTLWGDPDQLLSFATDVWSPDDEETDEKGDA